MGKKQPQPKDPKELKPEPKEPKEPKAKEAEPKAMEGKPDHESDCSDSEANMWDTISDLEGDPDYHAWVRDVWQPLLADKHTGVTQEGVYLQWREHGGLCAATGIPLIGVAGGKGMYSPELVTSGAREVRVVASYVAAMYGALARYGVSYKQFLRLVSLVDGECDA